MTGFHVGAIRTRRPADLKMAAISRPATTPPTMPWARRRAGERPARRAMRDATLPWRDTRHQVKAGPYRWRRPWLVAVIDSHVTGSVRQCSFYERSLGSVGTMGSR